MAFLNNLKEQKTLAKINVKEYNIYVTKNTFPFGTVA